jgi:hypothetical protein
VGSARELILATDVEQGEEALIADFYGAAGGDIVTPVVKSIETSFVTHGFYVCLCGQGGFEHEAADEMVSDGAWGLGTVPNGTLADLREHFGDRLWLTALGQ